jgi:hypothetical protein
MTVGPAKPLKVSESIDKKFNRSYAADYQVIASQTEGPNAVLDAEGVPAYGSSFVWYEDSDAWAFCDSAKAAPQEEILYDLGDGPEPCRKWIVSVTWSTVSSERSKNDPRNNPTEDPPVLGGSFLGESEVVFRDKDDVPIANSAGEPYEQLPTVLGNTDTLTMSYNTATIDLYQRSQMIGKVNSVGLWGLNERQVKLVRWNWKPLYAGELAYIKHDFEFHISRKKNPTSGVCIGDDYEGLEGWYDVRPNEGYAVLKTPNDNDTKVTKRDTEDMPLNRPVKLNCDGTEKKSVGMLWNIFAVEEEIDFHSIPGLPDPLPGPFT